MAVSEITSHPGKQVEFLANTKRWLFYGGARGGGKGQVLTAQVFTPFGSVNMGDIKLGQRVCTPDGRNSKVIGIYPLGIKDIYEVITQDGSKTKVTLDHLWKYNIANHNWRKSKVDWKLATTEQLIEIINNGKRIMLPATNPVQFTVNYKYDMRPINPYLLGLLLGDGCITGKRNVSFITGDKQIMEWVQKNSNANQPVWRTRNNVWDFIFKKEVKLDSDLEKLGLLGTYSDTKFIPKSYLYGIVDDRWKILQGLMDTDGTVSKDGKAYYTSVSEQLAKDVRFLVKSLGGRCTITKHKSGYKKDEKYIQCKDAYELYIRMSDNKKLFNLERKKDRAGLNNGGNGELKNKIVSIEKIGREPAQCIKIDSIDSLYITDDFIVTHNTWGGCFKAAYQTQTFHYEDAEGERITKKQYRDHLKKKLLPSIIIDSVSIDYPDYKALIIRRTFPDLEINVRPECDKLYLKDANGDPFAYWLDKKKCYVFPSGAKIFLVHCRDRNALTKYIGGNNHFVFIDEANQFPWEWIEDISSSVRSSHKTIRAQIVLTSNPGGIGHYWLKSKFVDVCPPIKKGEKIYYKNFNVSIQPYDTGKPYKDTDGVDWQYIPATVFDNPSLLRNPDYVNVLKNITNPAKRAMWLEGRWDAAPGLFFDNFIYENNTIQEKDFVYGEEYSKETHDFYRAIDYGTKNPSAVLFVAINKRTGKMIIFDELIMQKGNLIKNEFDFDFDVSSAPSIQAKMILAYTRARHPYLLEEDFEENVADSAMWQKGSEKNGVLYSPAELFEEAGLELTSCGRKERVIEASIVYNGFTVESDGTSKITIRENCYYTIESIQSIDQDPRNIDDLNTAGEDHAIDALKYLAKFVYGTTIKSKEKVKSWRDELKEIDVNEQGYSWKVV